MNTPPSTRKTLFRQQAEEYQDEQKRTKSTSLRDALIWTGVGTVLLVFLLIISNAFPDVIPVGLQLMIPISAGIILYGLYRIISSVIRSTKQVSCPKCGKVHEIFKKERLYMCTDCGTLLYMGKDVESPIEFFTCPYCEHQAAVSHDHGSFQCYNCGIKRSPSTAAVEWESTKCSSCEEFIPQEALFCKSCGQILKPLPSYDMNWKVGKDAHGHFHFARMLLTTFPAKEASLALTVSNENIPSAQRKWGEALDEMQGLLETLGEVQRSLEEALKEPELRAKVKNLLPEIDFLYARLLALEVKLFVWAEGPENQKLRLKSYGSPFDTFEKGPQIHARKRLEQILGVKSLVSAGSIGPWKGGSLLSAMSDGGDYTDPTKPSITTLIGYSSLQAEAKRFAEWAKQSGRSADLMDNIEDLQEIISARKKEVLPEKKAPTSAEKMEPVKQEIALAGSVTPTSSERIAQKMPVSSGESKKPLRRWGCLLTTCGSLLLALGLTMVAAIAASLFDTDSVGDGPVLTIARSAICVLPFFLLGATLLAVGIRSFRLHRKQQIATQTDATSEDIELEDSKDLFHDGLGLFNKGKFHEAIPILEKVTRIDPTFTPALFTLGGAYSKVAGEYGDDENAVRSWANKSADAFRKAISLASLYGGLNDKQLALAQKTVMTYDGAETAYQNQRETSSLPEDKQKEIYAEFMKTKNTELLQGIDIQDLTKASKSGELAQMVQNLERDASEAEKVAVAKITKKFRITEEQLMAIAQEGDKQKWPWGDK